MIKKAIKKGSIKFKLLVFTIILIIVLSAANLVVGLVTSYNGILNDVKEDLSSMGTVVGLQLSTETELMKYRLESVAKSDLSSVSPAGLETLAKENGWRSLGIADADGTIKKGSASSENHDYKEAPAFVSALNGKTVISSPFKDPSGALVINLYTPCDGGVLIAGLDGMYLSDLIKDIRFGKSGSIFIIDSTGTMIANVSPKEVQEKKNFIKMAKTDKSYGSAANVYSKMVAGGTGIDTYSYSGVKRICYYAPVAGSDGWYFGVAAPIHEMTSAIQTVAAGMLTTSFILVLLAIWVSGAFAGKLTKPLLLLNDRMKLLAEGNLTQTVPQIDSNDEIGDLAFSIGSSIQTLSLYVDDITRNMEAIAAGNLQTGPSQTYIGDFKRIETAMIQSVQNLSHTLSLIDTSAGQVTIGADQVSTAAQVFASGTAEQAAALEELSASIAAVAREAEQNTHSVNTAKDYVGQASSGLNDGNVHMQKLNTAMKEIAVSSEQISQITKVVEDIAFQTNILALNAAIEAARAGEAGKGFAVVADEVRSLAAKSGEAAKQTEELISHTVLSVSNGEKLADETAEILMGVAEKAQKVELATKEIEKASSQQAESIQQINQGLSQVSSVVQSNAATAEESSASSEELAAQAQTLHQEVSKFKLPDKNHDSVDTEAAMEYEK